MAAGLILLVPISIAVILFSWLIGSPIMALCNIAQGKFVRGGIWLCFGIFTLNVIGVLFLNESWADFTPIYYLIAFLVGIGEVTKLWFRFRKVEEKEPELVTGEPTQAEFGVTLTLNREGVYTLNDR
jgi:uncharacterized membrane protein YuzA (DUF378 family)